MVVVEGKEEEGGISVGRAVFAIKETGNALLKVEDSCWLDPRETRRKGDRAAVSKADVYLWKAGKVWTCTSVCVKNRNEQRVEKLLGGGRRGREDKGASPILIALTCSSRDLRPSPAYKLEVSPLYALSSAHFPQPFYHPSEENTKA